MYYDNKKISFVIPCYRSANTIGGVIDGIVSTVEDRNPYEIVCAVDGSPDNVYEVLKDIASKNRNVKVLNLSRNFGQANAIMAAFNYVSGDIIVALDDDGQMPPEECYSLIGALDENTDIAYADYIRKKESSFRLLGAKFAQSMSVSLIDMPKDIVINSYFACKRFLVDEMIKYHHPYTYLTGLVFRVSRRAVNVKINHRERQEGKSGYTLRKLVNHWLNMFTSFSIKPLRFASISGFVCAVLGFAYGIYTVINKIMHPEILIGYSSTMAVMLFIGGMIMIMLGLIGEYLGRLYINSNEAPQFVVRDTINFDEDKKDQ